MNSEAMSNRHPVDQLAMVRDDLKTLKEREEKLRQQVSNLMGSADSLGGDEWIARQAVSERKGSIDEAALRAIGVEPDQYRKPKVTTYTIRTVRREVE